MLASQSVYSKEISTRNAAAMAFKLGAADGLSELVNFNQLVSELTGRNLFIQHMISCYRIWKKMKSQVKSSLSLVYLGLVNDL